MTSEGERSPEGGRGGPRRAQGLDIHVYRVLRDIAPRAVVVALFYALSEATGRNDSIFPDTLSLPVTGCSTVVVLGDALRAALSGIVEADCGAITMRP